MLHYVPHWPDPHEALYFRIAKQTRYEKERLMRIIDHWLETSNRVVSPNHDSRADPHDISLIVIHCISLPPGEFGGEWIDRLFTNNLDTKAHPYFAGIGHLRVSAHSLIRRNGEITQYVPFNQRAWHAGESGYLGRSRCNDFSIGIELEGTEYTPFTDLQYTRLNELLAVLFDTYPRLSRERIVGHSDIAPGRKTDPGPYFEWSRLQESFRRFLP
jgi:AmpD protein